MEEKRLYGIRGATCTENNAESITKAVGELCDAVFKAHNMETADIVSIQFTVTPDLDALNPATALRRYKYAGIDTSSVPLFCSQEPVIKGMSPRVIRLLVTAYLPVGTAISHQYMNGTQNLRPDLSERH
ncbi:MAG: chorismate mutase [Treponema sp.]|nr:chorismate mutase [Treponema sp.]